MSTQSQVLPQSQGSNNNNNNHNSAVTIVPSSSSSQPQQNNNNQVVEFQESEPTGPAYCRPIIANLLPEYTNAHAEAIRQAFQPTSFRSLSSLTASGNIVGSEGGEQKPAFRVPKLNNVAFSDFEYGLSPYEEAELLKTEQRKASLEKQRKIAGDADILAFRTAFPSRKDRFDPIWDTPFLSEPYQESADEASISRGDHENSSSRLRNATAAAKPFVPAGVQKSIGKPTRALLNDAMTSLFRVLAEDWPDAQPTVLTTAEDLIVVYFPLEQIRNPDGVGTYMNHALRRNEVVIEFDLRKVVEGWNVKTDDNFLLFTLRPPWVRSRNFIKAAQKQEEEEAKLIASFKSNNSNPSSPKKQEQIEGPKPSATSAAAAAAGNNNNSN